MSDKENILFVGIKKLYDENNNLSVLRSKIDRVQDPHLHRAREVLCLTSFLEFKDWMEKATYYSKQMSSTTNVTIRSLKHPSAPQRECYRTGDDDYFKCCSCESSIAREEQWVQSIIANDKAFVPEQFAKYHFRRKFVEGSYISLDPKDNDNNNDNEIDIIDIDENSTSESNINQNTADAEFTAEENQAAYFKQLQPTPKIVKSLSETKLKNVMYQILGT